MLKRKKKQAEEKEKRASKKKGEKPVSLQPIESTQMNIPIKEILTTGTIVTKDGRYLRIIEVKAGTFVLRTGDEQDAIIAQFATLLKVMPTRFQIITMTSPADMSDQIEIVDQNIASEKNRAAKQMSLDYRKTLQLEEKRGITRRFFIVIQYEGGWIRRRTIEDVEQWFNLQISTIIDGLNACGNEVVLSEPGMSFYKTAEILYSMYNRDNPGKKAFDDHLQAIADRYFARFNNSDCYIPPIEYVAPKSIYFLSPTYVKINDLYYTYLYIPSNGYRTSVYGGWIANIAGSLEGVTVSVHIRKIPAKEIVNKLRRNIVYNKSTMNDTSDTSEASSSAVKAASAGYYLKSGLENNQDFCYMSIIISVSGKSIEIVDRKVEMINVNVQKMDMKIRACTYEEEQAMESTLPFNCIDENIYEKSKRNVLTFDLASIYPFTTFELNDPNGVYLGRDKNNNTLVAIDLFKRTNPNVFISGETGSGKTYAALLIAIRMRSKHIPIYIIAPEKDHEFRRVCDAMGGQFITLAHGSPNTINIMEIHMRDDSNAKIIDGDYQDISYLTDKVETIKVFIKMLIKDMNYEEQQIVDEALYRTYEKKGITKDNNSLWADEEHTHYKPMPILADLRDELKSVKRAERIYNILGIFTGGSGSSFNGQTNVNLNSDFTVISTQHLMGETMPLGIFLAMDFLWSKIKEDRTAKKALMIDEFWKMSDAADQMLEIAKTCRAYSCSFILATQQIKDVMKADNGIYGEGILNNCDTKIMMKMVMKDAENVQNIVGITDGERRDLEKFETGDALVINEQAHVEIHFESSKTEHMLITTSGDDLRKMIRQKKEEEEKKKKEKEHPKSLMYKDGELIKVVDQKDANNNTAIYLTADDFNIADGSENDDVLDTMSDEELSEFLDSYESNNDEENIDIDDFQLANEKPKRKIYTDDELITSLNDIKKAVSSTGSSNKKQENNKSSKENKNNNKYSDNSNADSNGLKL